MKIKHWLRADGEVEIKTYPPSILRHRDSLPILDLIYEELVDQGRTEGVSKLADGVYLGQGH